MSSDKGDQPTIKVAITGEEQPGPDRPEVDPGAMIGDRYRLGRRIGKGGMGEVMAARDVQVALGRRSAALDKSVQQNEPLKTINVKEDSTLAPSADR